MAFAMLRIMLSCVVYLRRIVEDRCDVGFLIRKSKVVLKNQVNWIISRKELEAANLCAELKVVCRANEGCIEFAKVP